MTEIGEFTFYGCSSLENITLPEGVTTIGKYALSNCESLTTVEIPSTVTELGQFAVGFGAGTVPDLDPDIVVVTDSAAVKEFCRSTGVALDGEAVVLPGDLNGDGELSVTDLVSMQKFLTNQSKLTAEQAAAADFNHDGKVNIIDGVLMRQALVALNRPVEKPEDDPDVIDDPPEPQEDPTEQDSEADPTEQDSDADPVEDQPIVIDDPVTEPAEE